MLKGIRKLLPNKTGHYKYFSTLIVPEINQSRINPSVHNLVTAALKLQSEVLSTLIRLIFYFTVIKSRKRLLTPLRNLKI
jgi:hypothetical protein